MVIRTGGSRRKSRYKFKRARNKKGKLSLRNYLAEYKPGEKVIIKPDSIVQISLPDPRYVGKTGVVKAKRGACYEVLINDIGKDKMLIIHPIHIKRCLV
jgi:large subunit ribosomal protein L21e